MKDKPRNLKCETKGSSQLQKKIIFIKDEIDLRKEEV